MAEKDVSSKILTNYNDVFADVLNFMLFDGEQVIKEEDLEDLETQSQYKDLVTSSFRELERDTHKIVSNSFAACLAGIENQAEPDRYACIRGFGYDGASYRAQLANIYDTQRSNTKTKQRNKQHELLGEPLEDLKPVPDILPVITIFVNYSKNRKWEHPQSLGELVQPTEAILPLFNDYKVQVLDLSHLERADVLKLHSDLGVLAEFLSSKGRTENYGNKKIIHMSAFGRVLSSMTSDEKYEEVCKLLEEERGEFTVCEIREQIEKEATAKVQIELEQMTERAEQETKRAEQEAKKAEQEAKKAEQETKRAELAEAKLNAVFKRCIDKGMSEKEALEIAGITSGPLYDKITVQSKPTQKLESF